MSAVEIELPKRSLTETLAVQRAAYQRNPMPSLSERKRHLDALQALLTDNQDALCEAIASDFGSRSRYETLLAEVWCSVSCIKHTRSHLKRWMKPRTRRAGLAFQPATAKVVPQPKGVVGIISPWNYPLFLLASPLVGALAAGNHAMLKPSELTPNTSALMAELIARTFSPDHVTVVQGGVEVAQEFSSLPFDHLLFTGSTRVGSIVMKAASANLTPVTLELGGKSPVVIHPSFDTKKAAELVMSGKLFNAGQTCIAPDYVLCPRDKVDTFVDAARAAVAKLYPTLADNEDYTSIINARHHARLSHLRDSAVAGGAQAVSLAREDWPADSGKLAPTLLLDVNDDMEVMQEEIFGPLLPIVPCDSVEEALDYVRSRPRPLSLYYFDLLQSRQQKVIQTSHSGGVVINDTLIQAAQSDLPFGGVGPSGMGAYHGIEGFETFSHMKSVVTQSSLNGTFLVRPPYDAAKMKTLVKLLLKLS